MRVVDAPDKEPCPVSKVIGVDQNHLCLENHASFGFYLAGILQNLTMQFACDICYGCVFFT